MKIAIDIGGVLSKYPNEFKEVIESFPAEIHIITDMHDKNYVMEMLKLNEIDIAEEYVHTADYDKYGELCKAILLKELKIDILIDDFAGYLNWDSSLGKAPIRLLIMPDPYQPYWSDEWKTLDNSEFGRRKYVDGNSS